MRTPGKKLCSSFFRAELLISCSQIHRMLDVWEESTTVALPSGEDALEHEGDSNDIDLDNVPACSQEALEEILGGGQKVQGLGEAGGFAMEEEQFIQMIADAFGYNDVEDDVLEHLIDVACDSPMRAEEYTNDTLNFISNPKNDKSRKLYERHQKQYTTYCDTDPRRKPESEVCICNYFSMLAIKNRYSPGNYWCIYSTLKTLILAKHRVDIKQCVVLKKLIKKLTEDHIKKKPDMFLYSEIKHGLTLLFKDDVPKDLLYKIGIAIMCYGLLRCKEMLSVEIKDATVEEKVNVNFPYETKRRVKGFKFTIPSWLRPSFIKCIGQISPSIPRSSRFMLNYNSRGARRVQNMGATNVGAFATELATRLEKTVVKTFTAKSFRRSGATQLVEAGVSIMGLCEAGNWKSASTAREYVEHSTVAVSSRMDMLDGGKRSNSEHNDNVVAPNKRVMMSTASDAPSNVTNTNCTVININATNVSGLASVLASVAIPNVVSPLNLKDEKNYD